MKNDTKPTITITMRDFFALPEVKECQRAQQRNPHGSREHRAAFDRLCEIAVVHGVESFFGEY